MKMKSVWAMAVVLAAAATAWAFDVLPAKPPIPDDNPMTPEKIELGRMLYFDPRLSADDTVSCNTCHDVTGSGTDNLPTSKGIGGQFGGRNAPTVWNSAFLTVQFWDGRAPTLEEQAKGPIINPVEMGMANHDVAVAKIKKIKGYAKPFKKAFGGKDPIHIDNIAKAIAAYERTLLTPDSPHDRFMQGDKTAMSAEAQEGMALFGSLGCVACHNGPNFAGPQLPMGTGFFMKFPTFEEGNPYIAKYDLTSDPGRFEATKDPAHKGFWRVPSLRNVEITGPYFHNGKVPTLEEAVRVMGRSQLNREIPDDQVAKVVAFLKSLTGKRPAEKAPKLPK